MVSHGVTLGVNKGVKKRVKLKLIAFLQLVIFISYLTDLERRTLP